MGRKALLIPTERIHVTLPENIMQRLTVLLVSPSQVCVPRGAYSNFIRELVIAFFSYRKLSLEPFGAPQGYFVSGPADMIAHLETLLTTKDKENHDSVR